MELKEFKIKSHYLLEVQKDGKQYNFEVKIVVSSDDVYKAIAIDQENQLVIGWVELKENVFDEEIETLIEQALDKL